MGTLIHKYLVKGNDIFPNSELRVLHYENALNLPFLFPGKTVVKLFEKNGWTNHWCEGIYTYHHYHSITHEVFAVIKGKTVLQVGGEEGRKITIQKGDVVIIPAGVAHKNMGKEKSVICIGAYPEGRDFDMQYGEPGERPKTDHSIEALPVPASDPVFGTGQGLVKFWK